MLGLCFLLVPDPGFSQTLEENFLDPPVSARPKGYWCLVNGNFDLSRMTEELQEFKEKGMGGIDIWDVAGWVDPDHVVTAGPPFMGDESLGAIGHAVREATEIGLEVGLTGDASVPAGLKRTHSNVTKGPNAWMYPWKDVPLIESGLLGPVSIRFIRQINISSNE